jgi:hypothetical protein
MGDEVRLWSIGPGEQLAEISTARLDLESRLQEWLLRDISILDPGLMVIGREVATDFGGFVDILCVDRDGDLVIVELKRDRTPREVTAQSLDYASWIAGLSAERVTQIATAYLGSDLEAAFTARFGADLPDTLNGDHRVIVVGSEVDPSSERIITYLSDSHGVNINAAKFQFFRLADRTELLARVFLIEPAEVALKTRARGGSKRRVNLTYEELEALADEAGVAALYDHAVAVFASVLQKSTTRSSIRFAGSFNGSRKVVISLLPRESSTGDGLRYQLYKNRYAELAKIAAAEVESLMPLRHDHWSYGTNSGPDWQGFEGSITNRDEIDRMAEALRRADSR